MWTYISISYTDNSMHVSCSGWYLDLEASCNYCYSEINVKLECASVEGFYDHVVHICQAAA